MTTLLATPRRTLRKPRVPEGWTGGETDTYAWVSKETSEYKIWIRYDYTNVPERTMYLNTFGYDGPIEIHPDTYEYLLCMSSNFTLKLRHMKEQ
jgi:hypothetical protein